MRALITGASSGIGRDIAIELDKKGYDLTLVSRDKEKLKKVKESLSGKNIDIIDIDLSSSENCKKLYEQAKNIDLLINNAGFGIFGEFTETSLDKEIELINTNIIAVHTLTKLYLKDMVKRNNGYILNVASIAGFMPGPLMSTYYASKAYVVRLTEGIKEELIKKKSKVKVSLLCPGPVNTNFNNVAGVKFNLKGLTSKKVAKYAVKNIMKNKFMIVPGIKIKLAKTLVRFVPETIASKVVYHMQEKKKAL